jgi:hypothetical protein
VVQSNSGAGAAYTNTHAIIGATLIIVDCFRVWNAMPNFFLWKQREQKGTLEIKATKIMLVDLK